MNAPDKSEPKVFVKCALPQCKGLRFSLFHKFPRNLEKCKAWLAAFDNPTLYAIPHLRLITMAICSRHFRISDYSHPESRKLNAVAVPSLNLKTLNQLDMCRHGKTNKVEYDTTERWPRDNINTEGKENNEPNTTKDELNDAEEFPISPKCFSNINQSSLASDDAAFLNDNLVSSSKDISDSTLVTSCVKEGNGFELVVNDGFIQMKDSQLDTEVKADILWMRHICRCSECFDSKINRPLIEFFEFDQDLQPVMATVIEETRRLDIIWSDGHTSSYNLTKLYEQLQKSQITISPNYLLWNFQHTQFRDDLQSMNFYELLQSNKSGIYKALDRLQKSGVLIIKQVPKDDKDSLLKKCIITKIFNISCNQIINEKRQKSLGEHKTPHSNCTFESMDKGIQILSVPQNKEHLKLQLNLVDGFQAIEQLPKTTQEFLALHQMDYCFEDDKGFNYKIKQPVLWKSDFMERIWFNPYHLDCINTQDYCSATKPLNLSVALKMQQNQWCVELNSENIIILDNYRICWSLKNITIDSELDCMYLERKHYLSSLNILKNI
ncbi:LOW QUALITY PROTEIN: trimethyllysine dioxygenase, mitochondrial-like [Lucilia sericata]|uniref:LOW QUALITY PROTEIN: trimethyllysine dioxygenase, mitochondrial-like n=1 Tax=Lucilia sericata TaxID=13632 RepID=UPI0018A7EEAE|nr:LOW QUALITY PROTEIN: trimethyllysine dioxygenase, mitochondrial-like [Lucilia sericata]